MPSGLYAQEKACKQEEKLLSRLQAVDLDTSLMEVLRRQADLLLKGMIDESRLILNTLSQNSKSKNVSPQIKYFLVEVECYL